ncbi:MAG: ABC transporter substrate-binding protein [Deltaproteobacteria bacterium]|nr:ABC transporter substrate-binding protein [Deltaproteobacteria bacterium]
MEKIRTNFKLVALSFLICFPINSEPKIGALFHLSGYASHWGKSELDAVKLALNSYPRATLFIEDTRSEVKECLNAYRTLVTLQKVQLVLGPTWTACYFAIGPLTDEFKVPIFAPSGTHYTSQPVHPLRFGLFYNPIDGVRKVVSYLVSKKVSSVSVVYTIEPFFLKCLRACELNYRNLASNFISKKFSRKRKTLCL